MNKKNKGFIALILTLSIAGTLLGLVLTASIETGSFFDQAMKKVYREMNYYYAYDCIDRAILMISHDYFFTAENSINISDYHCSILSVTKEGNLRNISTRGDYKKLYVYRQAQVEVYDHGSKIIWID
jgi:hypothetical protein